MAELGRQMSDQIRDHFPQCCMAALDMFKPLPLGSTLIIWENHARQVRHAVVSDSGETCAGMTELFGGRFSKLRISFQPGVRRADRGVREFRRQASALLSWWMMCE